jgi:hypothetical protein
MRIAIFTSFLRKSRRSIGSGGIIRMIILITVITEVLNCNLICREAI